MLTGPVLTIILTDILTDFYWGPFETTRSCATTELGPLLMSENVRGIRYQAIKYGPYYRKKVDEVRSVIILFANRRIIVFIKV